MIIHETIQELQTELQPTREKGLKIGFVPTMGYLHEGHLQLVRESMARNAITVVSIFVNPIQFNNPEDLAKYPRNLERDYDMLRSVGCDMAFVPSTQEMYPDNKSRQSYDLGTLAEVMEGLFRPGHFQGVATVVHKLFDIVQPHRAYFGMKDYQQLQVIRRLVEIERMHIEIVPCPTIREKDGLAMSSRNIRLGKHEREAAPGIYAALQYAKTLVPHYSPAQVTREVVLKLKDINGFQLEYFEVADALRLTPISSWAEAAQGSVACVAGFLGGVRLIDNVLL